MKKFRLPLAGAVLVVAAGAGLALTGQAGAVVSLSSYSQGFMLRQADTAVLNPDGTVTVQVTAACPTGDVGHIPITISERVGDAVVTGHGFDAARCDGRRTSLSIVVTPATGTFTEGTAWIEPELLSGAGSLNDEREVTVLR